MNKTEVVLPAMGEGIIEATVTRVIKKKGELVNEDESVIEVATDKVDSEISAPAKGIVCNILVSEGDVVKVGQPLFEIEIAAPETEVVYIKPVNSSNEKELVKTQALPDQLLRIKSEPMLPSRTPTGRFLSPVVRQIANTASLTLAELDTIKGVGLNNRITAKDIESYLARKNQASCYNIPYNSPNIPLLDSLRQSDDYQIIEMDRMRKIIAQNMLNSKKISPHVTSFHEVDVTEIVRWREQVKNAFFKREKIKLTYTPIFIQAVANALKHFPMINISIDGDKIIKKKEINIGMATALPNGNLIVPVIKSATDQSLVGLAKKVNDLAERARASKLLPHEISAGTFTVTNLGQFGNLAGTPIIHQPEVAILALGAIKKRPAVVETPHGDFIGIRHIMIMSLSYDHRIVDGALGGAFLQQIAKNMECFKGEELGE